MNGAHQRADEESGDLTLLLTDSVYPPSSFCLPFSVHGASCCLLWCLTGAAKDSVVALPLCVCVCVRMCTCISELVTLFNRLFTLFIIHAMKWHLRMCMSAELLCGAVFTIVKWSIKCLKMITLWSCWCYILYHKASNNTSKFSYWTGFMPAACWAPVAFYASMIQWYVDSGNEGFNVSCLWFVLQFVHAHSYMPSSRLVFVVFEGRGRGGLADLLDHIHNSWRPSSLLSQNSWRELIYYRQNGQNSS